MMYRPCTGRDHTLYNGILIGIALKELMVCDVDHHYLRLVILCKTCVNKRCCLQKTFKEFKQKDLKFILYYTLYVCLLLGEVGRWMLGHAVSAVIS